MMAKTQTIATPAASRAGFGDKRFLLPKSQVLAKPFKIFLRSRKQFRKDYEFVFKAIYWETTKTKKTDVVFESIQHLEDAHQWGCPRAKANPVGASASVKNQLGKITTWTQQNNTNELQTQALTCLKVVHDAIRVLDETVASMQIIMTSVTEEKSAEARRVRRRRVKVEEALLAAKVAESLAKWLTTGIDDVSAQARSADVPQWDDTTDFTSAFSFVFADASSGAGPVGSLFNDVFATHKVKIERKVTNFVAKMTKSAGMTRLQLDDNEPFKLDAAKFPRWCADCSCGEIAHQPFLLAISPMTLAWSFVGCTSREFVCVLAAHGHREELGHQ